MRAYGAMPFAHSRKGGDIYVDASARAAHMLIAGRTHGGKTSQLRHMIEEDILAGRGLCVLDFAGNLFDEVLRFCVLLDIPDRVVLVDPSHPKYSVALNYLERIDPDTDPGVLAHRAMAGISRLFKEDASTMPLWQRYGSSALTALAAANCTLLDLYYFVDPGNSTFRMHLLEKIKDFDLWKTFRDLEEYYRRIEDRARMLLAATNRGDKFRQFRAFKLMVGQQQSTINWCRAMDERQVVLCNLGSSSHLPSELAIQLAVIIFHQVFEAARMRRKDEYGNTPDPFYFYVDEFGRVARHAGGDFSAALDIFRQHGVPLILAVQRLSQLKPADSTEEDLLDAALSNTLFQMIFNLSHDNADAMVRELFAPDVDPDKIKYQGTRQVLTPHSGTERLRSQADTLSTTTPHLYGVPSGSGGSSSVITSQGWHESTVTDYDIRDEPDTPVYKTIEEQFHEYVREVMTFEPGEAYLKTPWRSPVRVRGRLPQDHFLEPCDIECFRDASAAAHSVKPATQVENEINERYRRLLQADYEEFEALTSPPPSLRGSVPRETRASRPPAKSPEGMLTTEKAREKKQVERSRRERRSIRDALVECGMNPNRARALSEKEAPSYLWFHIEQHKVDPDPMAHHPEEGPKRLYDAITANLAWDNSEAPDPKRQA